MSSIDRKSPSWYVDWRYDAVTQLQENMEHLRTEFRLDAWPRYDAPANKISGPAPDPMRAVSSVSGRGKVALKQRHCLPDRLVEAGKIVGLGQDHEMLSRCQSGYFRSILACRQDDRQGGGIPAQVAGKL